MFLFFIITDYDVQFNIIIIVEVHSGTPTVYINMTRESNSGIILTGESRSVRSETCVTRLNTCASARDDTYYRLAYQTDLTKLMVDDNEGVQIVRGFQRRARKASSCNRGGFLRPSRVAEMADGRVSMCSTGSTVHSTNCTCHAVTCLTVSSADVTFNMILQYDSTIVS